MLKRVKCGKGSSRGTVIRLDWAVQGQPVGKSLPQVVVTPRAVSE